MPYLKCLEISYDLLVMRARRYHETSSVLFLGCKAKILDRSIFIRYNNFRCGDTMSIENIVEKGELLYCYGDLLTARQKDCLDLYYNENLTLAEIAEHFHISRQAVHDAMRHGEEQLLSYEKVLHLAALKRKKEEAAEVLLELIPHESLQEARPLLKVLTE